VAYVIGIDTGGTFTDAFVANQHDKLAAAKTPSTPPNFAQGFLNAIDELADELGLSVVELLRHTDYIVHGTTSTLNSLVTGEVAQVGFLTTAGHADSLRTSRRYPAGTADPAHGDAARVRPSSRRIDRPVTDLPEPDSRPRRGSRPARSGNRRRRRP